MTDKEEAHRAQILARLAQSREELRRLLDPPRKESGVSGGANPDARPEGFPRSRTMQFLLGEHGLRMMGAAATGLLIARPAFTLRLLRMLPASGLARMLLMRGISALRSRKE
jgi:hypothetical protein